MNIEFRTCPSCNGYGVLDSGSNCRTCGGSGSGGLQGDGCIGSGEIMIDKDTGRRVTARQLASRLAKEKRDDERARAKRQERLF